MIDYQLKALEYIKGHLHKIYESEDEPLFVTQQDAIKAIEITLSEVLDKLDTCGNRSLEVYKTRQQVNEMVNELHQEIDKL